MTRPADTGDPKTKKRLRADSKLAKLKARSPEIVDQLRNLIAGPDGFAVIIKKLKKQYPKNAIVQSLTVNNLSTMWHGHLADEVDDIKTKITFFQRAGKEFETILADPTVADPIKKLFLNMLEYGFLSNQKDFRELDPLALAAEFRQFAKIENDSQKLALQREKLELDRRRVEAEEARVLAIKEAGAKGDLSMPLKEIYLQAVDDLFACLSTYKELNALLSKFAQNIRNELAYRAERFEVEGDK